MQAWQKVMADYSGFMTHVTCRLTAKNRDQLRNPTLGNQVQTSFTFYQTRPQDGALFRKCPLPQCPVH